MAENLVTPEKSRNEDEYLSDEYLAHMSYKQLQALAMSLKLPANVKVSTR